MESVTVIPGQTLIARTKGVKVKTRKLANQKKQGGKVPLTMDPSRTPVFLGESGNGRSGFMWTSVGRHGHAFLWSPMCITQEAQEARDFPFH